MAKKIRIYCAGVCGPDNPGGIGVAAFAVYDEHGEIHRGTGFVGGGPRMTDMVAEYSSVIKALEWANANCPKTELTLCFESHRLINQLSGKWKVRKPRLQKYWSHVKSAEGGFASVAYELLGRRDPRMGWLRSDLHRTYLDFFGRASKSIDEITSRTNGVSFKHVDERRVRTLVDLIYQFMQHFGDSQEAYMATKVLQEFFERMVGYHFASIPDADRVRKMGKEVVLRKIGEELKVPEPKRKRRSEEPEMMYG